MYIFLKRLFDVLFSLVILFLISPILVLSMILIKLESKGPVFFFQERLGINGEVFKVFKLRTMTHKKRDVHQKIVVGNPEVTMVGHYLRRFKVDELPQFINVLIGNMSIVGPRPEREFFINTMKDSIQKYLERHRVKCGITGWAQVNGLRGTDTSLQTRIDYDIYYIENWSIALDIKIIFKTVKEVFFSKEAF